MNAEQILYWKSTTGLQNSNPAWSLDAMRNIQNIYYPTEPKLIPVSQETKDRLEMWIIVAALRDSYL